MDPEYPDGFRAAYLILGKEGGGWRCPDGLDERADGGVVAHRRRRHRRHEGQIGQRRRHQQERLLAVALQTRQTRKSRTRSENVLRRYFCNEGSRIFTCGEASR